MSCGIAGLGPLLPNDLCGVVPYPLCTLQTCCAPNPAPRMLPMHFSNTEFFSCGSGNWANRACISSEVECLKLREAFTYTVPVPVHELLPPPPTHTHPLQRTNSTVRPSTAAHMATKARPATRSVLGWAALRSNAATVCANVKKRT